MTKLTGRAKLHDEDAGKGPDAQLYISTEFELVNGEGRVTIGNDAGAVGPTGRLASRDPGVRRVVHHVVTESRRVNGRRRPPTPAPKPAGKAKRPGKGAADVCGKCFGSGEYESVDGTWRVCDWCQRAKTDDDAE